ncbi:hypothetical protein [Streptomyces sp. NPDC093089]|uniref:hypothetical protein n=1 Tax=Streptomyces sp. NPDC093089 TaxID=3366024 RepID=UPI00382B6BED
MNALAQRELLSPEDMADAEHLLVLGENPLQLVELAGGPGGPGGPGGAEEALCVQGPEVGEAIVAASASAHPDGAGMEELRRLAARALHIPAARHGRAHKRGRGTSGSGRRRHR